MSNKLFVGALAYAVTDQDLQELFAQAGTVVSAKVIMDRDAGQSKGFAFVEMSTEEEAKQAIATLNGKEVAGRQIAVNIAKPMGDRPSRPNQGRPARGRY
jgi:cold-inducible RNA-binding protein